MLARPDTERELRIKIDTLEEEVRQLREQIARMTGRNEVASARLAFGLTEAESHIFLKLLHCGLCEYDQLYDAIYADGRLFQLERPDEAMRSHMKRIRRKTRPHGVDFRTIYSLGFEMGEEARIAARKIMAGLSKRTPSANPCQDAA
jgi:DNA-binding response OmpR family regulator